MGIVPRKLSLRHGVPHGQTESGGLVIAVICWSLCALPSFSLSLSLSVCLSLAIAMDDGGNKASVHMQSCVYTHKPHTQTTHTDSSVLYVLIRGAESAAENTSLGWETARHLREGVGDVD